MKRFLPVIFLMAAATLWAQDAGEPTAEDAADTTEESQEAATDDVDGLDDLDDLDELYPVEDEDEFIPSEDVAFGQSIPFPTDI